MKYSDALKRIYKNINAGKSYGYNVVNVQYPYFSDVLYKTRSGFIGWTRYGSSANKNTLKELQWIITVIFKTTPEDFEKAYTIG